MAKITDALYTMDYSIAGIPCQLAVMTFYSAKADSRADNPWDYHGYTEAEVMVLDRKGYQANWLDKKLSKSDRDQMENDAIESYVSAMEEDRYEF